MNYRYEADTHTHTIASGHAYNTIMEMARAAADKGLKAIAITDHAPAVMGAPTEMYFSNYYIIGRELFGLRLLMGVELNILNDGTVDLPEWVLKRQDIALASIHVTTYKNVGIEENTKNVLKIMDNPYIDILAHPDDSKMPIDYEQIVSKCAENGMIMEVNEHSYRSHLRENCEENVKTYLQLCKEKHVYVTIGSDAHWIDRVGVHNLAEEVMHKVDFPEELVLNSNAEKLIEYLAARKAAIKERRK